MERYERLENDITLLPSQQSLTAAIQLSNGMYNIIKFHTMRSAIYLCGWLLFPEPLKLALLVEARAWKTAYGHSLNSRYRASMNNIVHFVTEYSKRLSRPIKVTIIKTPT